MYNNATLLQEIATKSSSESYTYTSHKLILIPVLIAYLLPLLWIGFGSLISKRIKFNSTYFKVFLLPYLFLGILLIVYFAFPFLFQALALS